jgi:hypothetical protein
MFPCQGAKILNCSKANHASFWTRKICSCIWPPRKTPDKCPRNISVVLANKRQSLREINVLHKQATKFVKENLFTVHTRKYNSQGKLFKENLFNVHTRK